MMKTMPSYPLLLWLAASACSAGSVSAPDGAQHEPGSEPDAAMPDGGDPGGADSAGDFGDGGADAGSGVPERALPEFGSGPATCSGETFEIEYVPGSPRPEGRRENS
jgi:hypothetical protein